MSGIFEHKMMTNAKENLEGDRNLRKLFKSKFTNMKGYTFRVAALPYAPYLIKNQENIFSGYEILQLGALGDFLNFTYQTIEPPDGQWGKAGENGTWTGLIGHSLYGQTNWSMGMLSLTEDREAVIDFSTPFYFEGLSFVASLPKELPKYLEIIIYQLYLSLFLSFFLGLFIDWFLMLQRRITM